MKKPRLFVVGDDATDGTKVICGGPDLADAMKGLSAMLEEHVNCLLFEGDSATSEIRLVVKNMTDEEVGALPDI